VVPGKITGGIELEPEYTLHEEGEVAAVPLPAHHALDEDCGGTITSMPKITGTRSLSVRSRISVAPLRRRSANHIAAPATTNSSGMRSRCARSIGHCSAGIVSAFVMCQPQPTNSIPVWKNNSTKMAMTRSQSRKS